MRNKTMDAAAALQRIESANAAGNRKPDAFDRLSKKTNPAGRRRKRKKAQCELNCCTVVWHAWMHALHAVLWVDSADNFHVISHVYRMGEDAKVCTQGHDGAVRASATYSSLCLHLSTLLFQHLVRTIIE